MARRKRRSTKTEQDPNVKAGLAARLRGAIVTLPTSLIYKGKPVQWHDGVLYVDGRPIRRRPA